MPNLKPVPKREWPECPDLTIRPTAVWRSKSFIVQIYNAPNGVKRITVNKTTRGLDGDWRDGITWEELQYIKDTVGFVGMDAVEVFPKKNDIVNVANMRHLWVLPKPLDFIWRMGDAVSSQDSQPEPQEFTCEEYFEIALKDVRTFCTDMRLDEGHDANEHRTLGEWDALRRDHTAEHRKLAGIERG